MCTQTTCDRAREECHDDIEACENSCIGGSIESFNFCYDVCRSIDCPLCSGDSPCVESSYTFEITGQANARIESACVEAVLRDQRCGETTVDPNCSRASRLEHADAELTYDCHAATACGVSTDSCDALLPASDFGATFCGRIGRCSSLACTPEDVETFDVLARWYRPDVLEAALECVRESCVETARCLNAWFDTLFGP
jgi:hypothetical protein